MADDLDELLDEVEHKFCRLWSGDGSEGDRVQGAKNSWLPDRKAQAAEAGESARVSKGLTKDANEDEDIDEIIKDIIDDKTFAKNPLKQISKSSNPAPENITSIQAHGKRCCPVYLGGSTAPYGIGTNVSQRTCDRLRCTACDFHVSHFNDYQWDKSCDYYFFSRSEKNKQKRVQEHKIRKDSTK